MADREGLIILGNSGVGKSFICNLLLGEEVFKHQYKPTACTLETELIEVEIKDRKLTIFNIPGLIENQQDRIELNKKEIQKAFQTCPNSIICFVCGGGIGGRVLDSDVIAFNALHESYQFSVASLMFIVNQIKKNRDTDYDATAATVLQELCKVKVPATQIVFLHTLNDESPKFEEDKMQHKQLIINVLATLLPKVHVKTQEISLTADKIQQLKQEHLEAMDRLINQIKTNEALLAQAQKEIQELKSRPPIIIQQGGGGRRRGCVIC